MFLLMAKLMVTFPMMFWWGINPYSNKTRSTNHDEATEAYGKPKK